MRPAPATAPTKATAIPTRVPEEERAVASLPAAVLLAEGTGLVGLEAALVPELLRDDDDPEGVDADAEGVLEPETEAELDPEGVAEALPLAETGQQGKKNVPQERENRRTGSALLLLESQSGSDVGSRALGGKASCSSGLEGGRRAEALEVGARGKGTMSDRREKRQGGYVHASAATRGSRGGDAVEGTLRHARGDGGGSGAGRVALCADTEHGSGENDGDDFGVHGDDELDWGGEEVLVCWGSGRRREEGGGRSLYASRAVRGRRRLDRHQSYVTSPRTSCLFSALPSHLNLAEVSSAPLPTSREPSSSWF